jgi:NAD(P)-dependent dehydrogenase (short-subunit alcohol dehydrogenase family)
MEQVRNTFDVNFFGALNVTRAVWPLLRGETPGRIVHISSESGGFTIPFLGAYSASKYSLEVLSQALRRELSIFGIHSSTIAPPFIKSKMSEGAQTLEQLEEYQNTPWDKAWRAFLLGAKKHAKNAKDPIIVCKAVEHAIESKKPKTRYSLTPAYTLGRNLPDHLMDKIILKFTGLKGQL